MDKKAEIFEYLDKKEYLNLLAMFDEEPNTVRKYVTMITYDAENPLRQRALDFFLFLSKERAAMKQDFFREMIRRHLWGMNEEGANSDWSAPEIIGAIIASEPQIFGEYAPIMITAALEHPIFHKGMFTAIKMIGHNNRDLIECHIPELRTFLDHEDPELRIAAEYALQEMNEVSESKN